MSLRNRIKKILNEEKKGVWDKETKSLSLRERGSFKLAEVILKERHRELVQYNKKRDEESSAPIEGGYPNDYDEFIQKLKRDFPKYDYFHQIEVMIREGMFDTYAIPVFFSIKLLTEYILNYQNEGEEQRVDIVPKDEIWDYIKEQYFDCSREFFEHMWDEVLSGRTNYWNENVKERMWNELQPELEERMGDEEWQEENGVEFESLSNEESYFYSYWHYPLQNFGWDEMMLCDFYKEYISEGDIMGYFFEDGSKYDSRHNAWGKFMMGDLGWGYVINRNKLFW